MISIETLCGRFNSSDFLWQEVPALAVHERVALACACSFLGWEAMHKESPNDPAVELFHWEFNGLGAALRLFEEQGYGYISPKAADGSYQIHFTPLNFNHDWAIAKAEEHRSFLEALPPSWMEKNAAKRACGRRA